MEKQTFKTTVNAPPEKVWRILWGKHTYPAWTAVFDENSRVVTDWRKGSKAVFGTGEAGMIATIAENIPNEYMSIRHLGIIENGVEDLNSDRAKEWAGALENYTLKDLDGRTELTIDIDISEKYRDFFMQTWPQALAKVKALAEGKGTEGQKINPFLWFNNQAEEAVNFYTATFKRAKVGAITRYAKEAEAVSGIPAGTVMTVAFELEGQAFTALNGGPLFKFTPAISFLVNCETEAETGQLWEKLSEGGKTLMPLDSYPFSDKYGWVEDKFGVSWQLFLDNEQVKQKISPFLLFAGDQHGRAEQAINFYMSVFDNTNILRLERYGEGDTEPEGTIKFAAFELEGETFMAMDSSADHHFSFNESISLQVNCRSQDEVDEFWSRLTAEGGEEGQCGWLKDKFGVSWQIVPTILFDLLTDPDPEKSKRAMQAMLQMKKLDSHVLKQASEGLA